MAKRKKASKVQKRAKLRRGNSAKRITKATSLVASYFPVAGLFVTTQYEIPFKLSISTFHISIMAITPAIASHKLRHPSW
jgi:hypothetical protein